MLVGDETVTLHKRTQEVEILVTATYVLTVCIAKEAQPPAPYMQLPNQLLLAADSLHISSSATAVPLANSAVVSSQGVQAAHPAADSMAAYPMHAWVSFATLTVCFIVVLA